MLVSNERCTRKQQYEATFGIRDVGSRAVEQGVGAGNERFTNQADLRVVKHPLAMILIGGDDVD